MDEQAAEQLRKLAALHEEGVLTDDEYAAKKAALLGTEPAPGSPGSSATPAWSRSSDLWQTINQRRSLQVAAAVVIVVGLLGGGQALLGGERISKRNLESSMMTSTDLSSASDLTGTARLQRVDCIKRANDGSEWKCIGDYSVTGLQYGVAADGTVQGTPGSSREKVGWTVTVDKDGSWVAEPSG